MRTRFLFALLLTFSLLIAASPANAGSADELTPEKREDILLLLRQSGAESTGMILGVTMARQVVASVKTARPDVPPRVLAVLERELVRMLAEKMGGANGMVARMVPVYAELYTHEEIRQLLAFYQSPVGRKTVGLLPRLMARSQRIGQDMAKELQPELRERLTAALRREGIELKGATGQILEQMPGPEAGREAGSAPGKDSGKGNGADGGPQGPKP